MKSLRSIVAQTMTSGCVWKNNHTKRSPPKLISPTKGNGPIPETLRTPTPETFSAQMAKTPRKIPIRRAIPKTKPPAHPVHHIQTKGAAAKEEGAAAEAEVVAGVEAIRRKENGIASSTRRTMITVQTIAQTRKDLKLSSRRKRRRRGIVP
jgi:hypothetical protein